MILCGAGDSGALADRLELDEIDIRDRVGNSLAHFAHRFQVELNRLADVGLVSGRVAPVLIQPGRSGT